MWFCARLILLLAVLGAGWAIGAEPELPDFSKQTVDQLIVLLGSETFTIREGASNELERRLPNLPKSEVAKLVNAKYDNSDAEIRNSAQNLLEKYVIGADKSPATVTALNLLKVQQDKPVDTGEGPRIPFRFDAAKGSASAGSDADKKVLSDWIARYAAVRNHLEVGDTEGAKTRMNELETFINAMTADQFAKLHLVNAEGKAMTKTDVIDQIGVARALMPLAKQEIEETAGSVPADARPLTPVAAAGPLDAGKTIKIAVQSVLVPGMLDVTYEPVNQAIATVPPGFVAIEPIFDVFPVGLLSVAGSIEVSVEYGDVFFGLAPGIVDPLQLQLLRISNGDYQFLSGSNDVGNRVITASYAVSSVSGLNPFGEFMLIRAVPEPATLLLVVLGLMRIAFSTPKRVRVCGAESTA